MELHESFLARGRAGPIGVLFLGDFITHRWRKAPEVWQSHFGKCQPANFGIGLDRTENAIWRIGNGELDGISPRIVVLMIGTNNSGGNTADQILAAQIKIVGLIRAKLPQAKVLVLAIFPRGPRHLDKNGVPRDDGVARMEVIDAVNAGLPAASSVMSLTPGGAASRQGTMLISAATVASSLATPPLKMAFMSGRPFIQIASCGFGASRYICRSSSIFVSPAATPTHCW